MGTIDNKNKFPDWYLKPLDFKEVKTSKHIKRVLFLDPTPYYKKVEDKINPLNRYQEIRLSDLFPDQEGVCACGCGKALKKGQRKWSSFDCQKFAKAIWEIISGRTPVIGLFLKDYFGGYICSECGNPSTEVDHIIPVNQGGGGSWLSNFRFLCKECHKIKTRTDNNWTKL